MVIACKGRIDDSIFSRSSLRWVDAILGAIVVVLLLLGMFLVAVKVGGDPGTGMLLTLTLLGGAVLAPLMVVVRAQLWQATTLRTDMEAVI